MEDKASQGFVELVAAGMILVFVLATFIVIFVFIYRNRMIRQELVMEQLTIEHQKTLIHASIEVIDKERGIFASNLHDEIGAHIALAKMSLSSLDNSELNLQEMTTIDHSMKVLDDISDSIRRISHNLHPPVLLKLGLVAAIQDYLNKIPKHQIAIDLSENLGDKRFTKLIELHVYRILQEAISNAMKHAKCTQICISIIKTQSLLQLQIVDDGIGLNQNDENGLGLLNMNARAEIMGFDFSILNKEKGVEICLKPKTT